MAATLNTPTPRELELMSPAGYRQEATERAARKALGLKITGPLAPADASRVASKRLELEDVVLKEEIRTRAQTALAQAADRALVAGFGTGSPAVAKPHWLTNVWKAVSTKLLREGSEDVVQATVIAWCDGPGGDECPELRFVYHVPNGGGRSRTQAALMRLLGVRPGVADLVCPFPRGGFTHLYLELKREGDARLSEAQQTWHKVLRAAGAKVAVCHGSDAARDELLDYIRRPVTTALNARPSTPAIP